ncbi:MAG: hypothetical protein HQK56_06310 [Deltaproteobacteria bacterium]|nr:hypothetical protein [Deltaproteobacteria bacterium]
MLGYKLLMKLFIELVGLSAVGFLYLIASNDETLLSHDFELAKIALISVGFIAILLIVPIASREGHQCGKRTSLTCFVLAIFCVAAYIIFYYQFSDLYSGRPKAAELGPVKETILVCLYILASGLFTLAFAVCAVNGYPTPPINPNAMLGRHLESLVNRVAAWLATRPVVASVATSVGKLIVISLIILSMFKPASLFVAFFAAHFRLVPFLDKTQVFVAIISSTFFLFWSYSFKDDERIKFLRWAVIVITLGIGLAVVYLLLVSLCLFDPWGKALLVVTFALSIGCVSLGFSFLTMCFLRGRKVCSTDMPPQNK